MFDSNSMTQKFSNIQTKNLLNFLYYVIWNSSVNLSSREMFCFSFQTKYALLCSKILFFQRIFRFQILTNDVNLLFSLLPKLWVCLHTPLSLKFRIQKFHAWALVPLTTECIYLFIFFDETHGCLCFIWRHKT